MDVCRIMLFGLKEHLNDNSVKTTNFGHKFLIVICFSLQSYKNILNYANVIKKKC